MTDESNPVSDWMIDAEATGDKYPPFAFCPITVEDNSIVLGLTYVSDHPPYGKVVGIFHNDGQEECDGYIAKHLDKIEEALEGYLDNE